MKKTVKFRLAGCDDITPLCMEVTEAELDFLKRLAEESKKTASYGCMPILVISSIEGEED